MSGASGPSAPAGMAPARFRSLCADLSGLRYRDIAIGATLNDCLLVNVFWGHGDWRLRTRVLDRARSVRHRLVPWRGDGDAASAASGRLLMTWQASTPRSDEMLLPVLEEMGAGLTAVIAADGTVPGLPQETVVVDAVRAVDFDPGEWRAEYRRCRPAWAECLRDVCQSYDLAPGAFALLSHDLMVASQRVEGLLRFLDGARPPVVLTEYDRSHWWSCLIVAANHLGIPTVTLVHGVVGPDAIGFAPALAGRVICWGDADREKFLAAGEPAEKLVLGGCPRISRDLPGEGPQAKARLGFDERPLVLLATSPDRGYLQLAEAFCRGVEAMPEVAGMVRLHPAENLALYAEVAERHPAVRFAENRESTLAESLAAADVLVVRGSGMGGDALVKRRPVIVLDPARPAGVDPIGYDWDLIHRAGCPFAHTPQELVTALTGLLHDEPYRRERAEAAERYVQDFCSAFGRDSARIIAAEVKAAADLGRRSAVSRTAAGGAEA